MSTNFLFIELRFISELSYLETSWTPVDKLDGSLGLNGSDGCIDIFWHDVSSVQHAAGHVLSMPGIAFHHLVGRFEAGIGDFGHTQLLVVSFFSRYHRCVGYKGEVDSAEQKINIVINLFLKFSCKKNTVTKFVCNFVNF